MAAKKKVAVESGDHCFSFCAVPRQKGGADATEPQPVGAEPQPPSPKTKRPTFEEKKRKGLSEPLLRKERSYSPAEDFDYILVFPLPSVTTEEEEAEFRSSHAEDGKEYASFLTDALVDPEVKEEASIACGNSLESLRTCTIELFLSLLRTLGKDHHCEVFQFTSIDSDELFVCVNVSEQVAEDLADVGNYQLQLGGEFLEHLKVSITKNRESLVPAFTQYDAYMKEHKLLKTFEVPGKPDETTILRQVDKMRLIYDAITDFISLSDLERLGLVKAVFPAHNLRALAPLQTSWANFRLTCNMDQPIDEVRDYLGEEVAFYFLFVQFVMRALLYLSCLAAPCVLMMLVGYESLGKIVFTFGNMMWFTGARKAWRRQENFYANRWGTDLDDFGSIKELLNPDFKGEFLPASYDENVIMLQPDIDKQRFGYLVSVAVTILYLVVVVTAASANQTLAAWCDTHHYKKCFALCSVLLTAQIKVFDFFWDKIGTWLTHLEQHVELKRWNQSKSQKTFFMKFITAFNVFYYIAFFQPTLDPVGCRAVGGCPSYLQQQLVICFCTYIAFGVMDIALPFLTLKYALYAERKELEKKCLEEGTAAELPPLSFWEHQAKMLPYEGVDATGDYLQIMLPLSFVVLFGPVMPLCALLCVVTLATQLRADAWKLLNSYRRTFPSRAGGIGVWNNILGVLSYLSIVNNAALLLTQVEDWRDYLPFPPECNTLTAFFVLENLCMFVKVCYDALVSDVPEVTLTERMRQEVQRTRLNEAEHEGHLGDIKLECTGDAAGRAFHKVEKLAVGHRLFTETPAVGRLW